MSGDEPQGDRHVKFTDASMERLARWAEHASDRDYDRVGEVLLHVVDGTWRNECGYHKDVVHSLTWHIQVRRSLIVTVRFAQEYPTVAQLIYIGPPDMP